MSPRHIKNTERLEKTVELLDRRYGPGTLQLARDLPLATIPPHIATGFAALDALTGCNGIPLGHITLLTGKTTSGKLSLAYQHPGPRARRYRGDRLHPHQRPGHARALWHRSHPHTLFARAPEPERAVPLLFDLLQGFGLRAILIDGLGDLLRTRAIARGLTARCRSSPRALRQARCALLCLDEPAPPWLTWLKLGSGAIAHAASLQIDIHREAWTPRARWRAHRLSSPGPPAQNPLGQIMPARPAIWR